MSYFKKFCDLIGGIGAAFATVFLLGRYMEYNPAEGESKLKLFFSTENAREYRQYLIFIALLFGAVLLGRLLKRFPAATLVLSVLPLCQVMGMLFGKRLYERAEFYVFVTIVFVTGNIYEAYYADRESNWQRNQLEIGSALVGIVGIVFSILSMKFSLVAREIAKKFYDVDSTITEADTLIKERFSLFGVEFLADAHEGETKVLVIIAVLLSICVILSLLLKKWTLLNVILAAVPLIVAVSALHAEKLVTSPMLVIVPAAVYFFCRAAFVGKDTAKDCCEVEK